VVSGGGEILSVTSRDRLYPGVYRFSARLGAVPGRNVFRITAGGLTRDLAIESR
jgi:hypothetical protein